MGNKTILLLMLIILCISSNAQTPAFKAEDYKKALWMTTRFYGAQRMGNDVNWLTAGLTWDEAKDDNWVKNSLGHQDGYTTGKSFLKDADGDYDLTGGWFDCGDHVLFGQTFYYAAYSLLLGYSEFASGYGDYYSGDYHGYINSGKFNWEDKKGVPNGIPDILDECKAATDFMLKAVRDKNTFYYQKGVGDQQDHKNWVTSVMMSSFVQDQGGEYDKPRVIGKATENATSMVSLAGASLAAMSRLYKDYDATYAAKCLEKAKVAYDFATSHSQGNTGANMGGEYPAKPKYLPDLTILCAELYRATGQKTYLDKCNEYTGQWINDYNHYWTICYNNTEDLGLYAYAAMGASCTYYTQAKNNLKQLSDRYNGGGNMLNTTNTGWGDLRYMAAQCFVKALNAKLQGASGIDPYVITSVDYIMGHNGGNQSYITGFGEKSPLYPHHRNYYRSDRGKVSNVKQDVSAEYKYRQLGYMVGGTYDGTYNDDPDNYRTGEGGIDFNCGLVGALAYITSKIAPADTKTVTKLELTKQPSTLTYTIGDKISVSGGQIKVTYSDSSIEYLDVTEQMVSGFSSQKPAEKLPVTISYKEKTVTYYVKIEKHPLKISMLTTPKTEYIRSEKISVEGGMIKYEYNDGSYEEIALTTAMVSGFSSTTTGQKTLTVTYEGLKTSYKVMVNEPPVIDIHLSPAPAKKVYQINEKLDLAGGRIEIYYKLNDSETRDITEDMVSGFRSDKAGTYTITVSYGGFQETYKITVEKKPSQLIITSMPKTSYIIADLLDVSGGRLRYEYNDGTFDEVDLKADMVSGFLNSTAGTRTLTVRYGELICTYDVTFTKAPVSAIEVSAMPANTKYNTGDPLDITGAQITILYANNESETIPVSADMVSGYNTNNPGTQTITISYMGHTATFEVIVEKPSDPEPVDPEPADPVDPVIPDDPEDPNTPVENIQLTTASIYSYGHTIFVENFDGLVEVFSISGTRVFSGTNVREIQLRKSGIYIVKAGAMSRKVVVE